MQRFGSQDGLEEAVDCVVCQDAGRGRGSGRACQRSFVSCDDKMERGAAVGVVMVVVVPEPEVLSSLLEYIGDVVHSSLTSMRLPDRERVRLPSLIPG